MTDPGRETALRHGVEPAAYDDAASRARALGRSALELLVSEGRLPREALQDAKTIVGAAGTGGGANAATQVTPPPGMPGGAPSSAAGRGEIPTRLGTIRIEGLLGEGGMGRVYRGYDEALERPVVVKVLSSHLASSEEFRTRFLREARAAARLDHANIVTVHGAGEAEGLSFIVMQFVDGETLDARLREKGPLPVDEALRVIRDAARGVSEAHRLGIIHRDLKPGNLMLTRRGEVKVLDFGLARVTDTPPVSQPGEVMGTLAFMPPEQAEGSDVDVRADVYALGATLYALLAGHPPFQGAPTTIIKKVLLDPPPPLGGLRADIPPPVVALVERCLAKEPAGRFATAADLAAAIETVAGGGAAPPPPAAPGPGRMRVRVGIAAVVLLALLAAAVAVYFPPLLARQRRAAALAQARDAEDPAERVRLLRAFLAEHPGDPEGGAALADACRALAASRVAAALALPTPGERLEALRAIARDFPESDEVRAVLVGAVEGARAAHWQLVQGASGATERFARAREFLAAFPDDALGRAVSNDLAPFQSLDTAAPTSRWLHGMAYDPERRVVVLCGGNSSVEGPARLDDNWIFDGERWTAVTGARPGPRTGQAMAFDPGQGGVLLFGGFTGGDVLGDSWLATSQGWARLTPNPAPPARHLGPMVHDAARGGLVLFGGRSYQSALDDTWVFRAGVWSQPALAAHPSARFGHMAAYDPVRGVTVIFGGTSDGERPLGDTWVFDGSRWREVRPAASPPPRKCGAMAFLPAQQAVILFGGLGADGQPLSDVWAFDGETWTERHPFRRPPASSYQAMVQDEGRGVLVVFGGRLRNSVASGTWVYPAER